MKWITPTFDVVKMDAEIGSYQEDFDPMREGDLARGEASASRIDELDVSGVARADA
jgi:hypothetical protein